MHIQGSLLIPEIFVRNEIPSGLKNRINQTFTTTSNFVANSTEVWCGGLKRSLGLDNDYVESGDNQIVFNFIIYETDNILVSYKKQA